MHEYVQKFPGTRYPLYTTYARAVLAMLPALFVNPGVGINAGGALPDAASETVVKDFASDACEPG
jgi:hypothetical protein